MRRGVVFLERTTTVKNMELSLLKKGEEFLSRFCVDLRTRRTFREAKRS